MSENGQEIVTFQAPSELIYRVGVAAAIQGINRSEFIRRLLKEAVDDTPHPTPPSPQQQEANPA